MTRKTTQERYDEAVAAFQYAVRAGHSGQEINFWSRRMVALATKLGDTSAQDAGWV